MQDTFLDPFARLRESCCGPLFLLMHVTYRTSSGWGVGDEEEEKEESPVVLYCVVWCGVYLTRVLYNRGSKMEASMPGFEPGIF